MAEKAVAYMRTSSAGNVGPDRDSEQRQRTAIETYARNADLEIVEWFYDPGVSGADPIESRPGFAAMLERIAGNGIKTILVETASRFARDLMVQEVGFAKLQSLGISLVAADNPQSFLDETPTAILVRQLLGAVSQFDRAMTVAKLKGARDRKRQATGRKVEGRKSHLELRPEVVALVKRLRRKRPKGGVRSLWEIAQELGRQGLVDEKGRSFSVTSVRRMLGPLRHRSRPKRWMRRKKLVEGVT